MNELTKPRFHLLHRRTNAERIWRIQTKYKAEHKISEGVLYESIVNLQGGRTTERPHQGSHRPNNNKPCDRDSNDERTLHGPDVSRSRWRFYCKDTKSEGGFITLRISGLISLPNLSKEYIPLPSEDTQR